MMYAYVELAHLARTDSIIQSLSWMNFVPTTSNDPPSQDENTTPPVTTTTNYRDGWLATGNANHIVSVTFTSIRPDEHLQIPDRTNFNLRAHRTEVRFISWNVPYQKLATVDEKGVIFVWVKHENRWSLELINDRSHPVIDMSWSHDGRMTVICYEDGYVLVGSVTGQRYWSTVVNTPHGHISAVTWTPDVAHVLLGTSQGNLILMDHHGNTTDDLIVSTHSITQLLYSCPKFYPGAPDNNASKFVNDEYVLACALANGQVLFLRGYSDPSPITVDTELENIKMDWSSSDEILAVAGHKRLNDSSYHNEILFYTRRGEFLYRLHIPQTTQSLSALCWAHDNAIVFAACGSFVYTIWITHKPLPSMLTLCQMKIKEHLLNNSLQNLDRLALPHNLQEHLRTFYRSTIKGFLPDPKSLRSFVCYPLKSNLRLQCTMKRIDLETDNPSTMNTSNYSGAIYVLYLEYLGGLIPLLTAKRVSKICPDFIIFDPQMKSHHLSLSSTSQSPSKNSSRKSRLSSLKSRSNTFDPMTSLEKNRISNHRRLIYLPEHEINPDDDDHDNRSPTNSSSSGCSSENDSDDERQREKSSRKKFSSKVMKQKQNNKLCTIAANIWGTRFKFYGHSTCLPEILGSVTYKTSFLHLQPRQMTVTVANNYNARKVPLSTDLKRHEKKIHSINSKTQQQLRKEIIEEDDEETMTALSSSKLNIAASIPIAPMSPQLGNVRSTALICQQAPSTTQAKKSAAVSSPNSSRSSQRVSMSIASSITHPRHRFCHADSSAADSSSTSPINLSRSTSPAASIANFIRPISPPYIQVKEPLSPKFARASSTTMTSHRQRSPPSITIPSMTNNIDASTASATTTLIIDDSSGYDSSENPNQRSSNSNTTGTTTTTMSVISTVPESCFEPETYRNLYPLTKTEQKMLSLSDPTLNQISKVTHHSQPQATTINVTTTVPIATVQAHQSTSSVSRTTSHDDNDIHADNEVDHLNMEEEEHPVKEKTVSPKTHSRHRYSSPRHRMMTCTSAMNDSSLRLSPSSDVDQSNENSFYAMQNRPPLWNEQSQVYQLDFGGRVTLESAKNFQIEFQGKQVIQFGRIENNCYTLDFEWPFSPLQAFAVALANITQRLK